MFNKNFYPTPTPLADKMWAPYEKEMRSGKYSSVLEPSVGKGDLIFNCDGRVKVYACETDENLRKLVSDKVTFVAHDFLSYWGGSLLFDLIIMNPPFDRGDEHLLHAWDLLARGDLCCLLNAETVRNPYTDRRKALVKIIEANGSYEIEEGAFVCAEKKTYVDVAIVRLHKDQVIPELDYSFDTNETKEDEALSSMPAIRSLDMEIANELKSYVRAYNEARKAFAEYCRCMDRMKMFISPIKSDGTSLRDMISEAYEGGRCRNAKSNFSRVNDFSDSLRISAWDKIIEKFSPREYMTEHSKRHINEFFKVNGRLDLTAENVNQVIGWLIKNSQAFMDESCEDIFDQLTMYTVENRGKNGWKTNSGWVVADKVIIPYALEVSRWSKDTPSLANNQAAYMLHDFERVLCWLDGKKYDGYGGKLFGIKIMETSYGEWNEGTYCDIQCFKKGTIHLRFNNSKLLENFNLRACRRKNWLSQGKSK